MNEHMRDKIKIHLDILSKSKALESYCTNCGACCHAGVNIKKGVNEHRIYVNDLIMPPSKDGGWREFMWCLFSAF